MDNIKELLFNLCIMVTTRLYIFNIYLFSLRNTSWNAGEWNNKMSRISSNSYEQSMSEKYTQNKVGQELKLGHICLIFIIIVFLY